MPKSTTRSKTKKGKVKSKVRRKSVPHHYLLGYSVSSGTIDWKGFSGSEINNAIRIGRAITNPKDTIWYALCPDLEATRKWDEKMTTRAKQNHGGDKQAVVKDFLAYASSTKKWSLERMIEKIELAKTVKKTTQMLHGFEFHSIDLLEDWDEARAAQP